MRILLVDDHAIVRHGLATLLREALPGAEFGEAADAAAGLEALAYQNWDLAIVDIALPGRTGLDLLADLRAARIPVPVLIVSAHAEQDYAIRALKLGAVGYVCKQSAADTLVTAVGRALAGGRYISPTLAERLAGTLSGGVHEASHETLSNRELQVLRLIAVGLTLKEIGVKLSLSEKTIATYRSRITEKMGFASNVELTRYALKHGLVD
jgi:two-component system invasion response regulator UvrY